MTSWIEGLIYAQERGMTIGPTNGAARDLAEAYGAKRSLREHIQAFEARGNQESGCRAVERGAGRRS